MLINQSIINVKNARVYKVTCNARLSYILAKDEADALAQFKKTWNRLRGNPMVTLHCTCIVSESLTN